MPTSEPYVPSNLPYGERQNTVAAMEQAGVPLRPGAATAGADRGGAGASPRPSSGPAAAAPASGLDLLAGRTPGDFQFLADPDAQTPDAQPAGQSDSPLQALAQSSQSTFGMAVLSRLSANTRR